MICAYIAFTAQGLALAQRLAAACPGSVARGGADGVPLADWTARQFAQSDALIFVGAAGIAVRAIAPHCRSKAADPAVVVLDEGGQFAIPLLSGHLGGANDLARWLAAVCGAVPVITTATDGRGVFAVDEWARRQNCAVAEPERIKKISGALLAGEPVHYAADWPLQGTPPAGVMPTDTADCADFALTLTPRGEALHVVPRIAALGIGCKRGTSADLGGPFVGGYILSAARTSTKRGDALENFLLYCQMPGFDWAFIFWLTFAGGQTKSSRMGVKMSSRTPGSRASQPWMMPSVFSIVSPAVTSRTSSPMVKRKRPDTT